MKTEDLHWLAGVIDKGCAIVPIRGTFMPRGKAYTYVLRLCISSTNFQLVERIHKLTQMGYISTHTREMIMRLHKRPTQTSQIQDRYTLYFHSHEAVRLLEMVKPYLRTQERRADIALALQKAVKSRRRRQNGAVYRQDVDRIDRLVMNLKKKGTRTKV